MLLLRLGDCTHTITHTRMYNCMHTTSTPLNFYDLLCNCIHYSSTVPAALGLCSHIHDLLCDCVHLQRCYVTLESLKCFCKNRQIVGSCCWNITIPRRSVINALREWCYGAIPATAHMPLRIHIRAPLFRIASCITCLTFEAAERLFRQRRTCRNLL